MKKLSTRVMGIFMVLCMLTGLFAAGGVWTVLGQSTDLQIYNLTVNDLASPLAIDETPRFGWRLASETTGQRQTDYRIVVTEKDSQKTVWDTDKVSSSDTSDILYAGEALQDCTAYLWTLTVWASDGEVYTAKDNIFETGFLNTDMTDGASWISLREAWDEETDEAYAVNYAVDMDILKMDGAFSLILGEGRAVTNKTLMWQIVKYSGNYLLKPHYYDAGYEWQWRTTSWAEFAKDAETYADLSENGFHLRVTVNDKEIKTYINGTLISEVELAPLNVTASLRVLGVRGATNENFVLDNLTVTDYSGNADGIALVSYDFETSTPTFKNGNSRVENGAFTTYLEDGSGRTWFGEEYFSENLDELGQVMDTDYAVDVDILKMDGAFSLILGEGRAVTNKTLMWQIVKYSGNYLLKPHYYDAGYEWQWRTTSWVEFAKDTESYTDLSENGFHLRVELNDEVVKTYINGTLISEIALAPLNVTASLRELGVRGATNENFVLDNLTVTDYSRNKSGTTLVSYDFETSKPTFKNSNSRVENGTFTTYLEDGSLRGWFGEEYFSESLDEVRDGLNKPQAEYVDPYTFEADVAVIQSTASLCFAMADTKNYAMWQFIAYDDAVILRPHTCIGGNFNALDNVNITSYVTPTQMKSGVHVKIYVDGTAIKTYVGDDLVDTREIAGLSLSFAPMRFGTRCASGEEFTLDNLKAVATGTGKVLFDYDCERFNPLYRGKIQDGKIHLGSDKDYATTMVHNGTATLRRTVNAEKEIANARLYITSYGMYTAFINGTSVATLRNEVLTPGWTLEEKRLEYDAYDITKLMQQGENTVAVSLNDGWASLLQMYYSIEPSAPLSLLAKVLITYTDGTTEWVVTDKSWMTARTGPVLSGDIYQGEAYDATADVSYRENGYDTSSWLSANIQTVSATVTARNGGSIYVRDDLERHAQKVVVYETVENAVADTQYGKIVPLATYGDEAFELKAGQRAVVDLGQNAAGWEKFTVSAARGTEILVRHAETLNDNNGLYSRGNDGPEGSVYTANLRNAPAKTVYICSGNGQETYHPTVTYYGFRYLEITASADITVHKVSGETLTSITKEQDSGTFTSSSALLNQLYSNIKWSQYSNYFGQATDCPQRDERLGYSGDQNFFAATGMYNADVKAFSRNFMKTLADGQASDGAYGNTLPFANADGSAWAGVGGYADAGILIPYRYYRQYGDTSLMEEYWPSMTKYMDYLYTCGAERIGQQFGDWLSTTTNDSQMVNFISYVYTIWDTQVMQEMATVLGKTDEAKKYAAMEQRHLGFFREKFLDENGDLNMKNQQTSYLFALKLHLYADDAAWQRGKEALRKAIVDNGNRINTGFMGTSIILETLEELDMNDLAYKLLMQENNPSWLYSVKQGATTMWERWNSYSIASGFGDADMNSFNHYSYGSAGAYLYSSVLGIQPLEAGYTKALIAPKVDASLTHVSGSYDSVNGKIESAWALQEDGTYAYTVRIPANMTAKIELEQPTFGEFAVNGVAADAATLGADGIAFVGKEDGLAVFEATSGEFRFVFNAYPLLTAATQKTAAETFDYDDVSVTLTDKFHLYYNREAVYGQVGISGNTDTDDVYGGPTDAYSAWVASDGWLKRDTKKTWGEVFRKIDSLVPLNSDGEEISLSHFETTFDVRFDTATFGAAILGFRQATPGKFTGSYYSISTEQGFVAIGQGGITISAGENIVSDSKDAGRDMYNHWQTETFSEKLPYRISVKVQVVGTHCKVWIYNYGTDTVIKSYDEEIAALDAGTLAYGVSAVVHSIGNIHLKALDQDGNAADLLTPQTEDPTVLPYRGGIATIIDVEKTENGYRYTLAITPKTGYQLSAGGFYAEDTDGTLTMPQRVGWRQDGDGNAFTVETTGGGLLHAAFVGNRAASGNIAPIGTSVNAVKKGLRFVHRAYAYEKDGARYMWVNGEEKAVADYGVLIGAASVIGEDDLTTELAAQSQYIQKISVKERDVYYDYCTEYVDMSACIVNLDKVEGGFDMDVTTRAYVQLEDGTVLYGNAYTTNYTNG